MLPRLLVVGRQARSAAVATAPLSTHPPLLRIGKSRAQAEQVGPQVCQLTVDHDMMTRKFVNCLMYDGKKSTAQRVFDDMLTNIKIAELQRINSKKQQSIAGGKPEDEVAESTAVDPKLVLQTALDNVKPIIGCIPVRRGATVYQVPTALAPKRKTTLAIKWVIAAARSRKGKPMADRLMAEILDAYKGEGTAIKRKIELHKTAEANRVNSSLRY
eukprot:m.267601 g.267601  ORF g.267601 m.267601 type:complete len:215 (+) comp22804_c7_seq3:3476-4120(+)